MNLFGNSVAIAERERQLVELLGAVRHAQQVARALCKSRDGDNGVKLLFGQLEEIRLEVEHLRRGNVAVPFEEIDPKWTGLLPWRMAPEC